MQLLKILQVALERFSLSICDRKNQKELSNAKLLP